jgi:hypothetical protein
MRSRVGVSRLMERCPMCIPAKSLLVIVAACLAFGPEHSLAEPEIGYGFGSAVAPDELKGFVSTLPDGRGLPQGSGSSSQGRQIYLARCASCHGVHLVVGAAGFELATPCTPCKCATRLRYAPTGARIISQSERLRWAESRDFRRAAGDDAGDLATQRLAGHMALRLMPATSVILATVAGDHSSRRLRAPLMVNPSRYSNSRMRRTSRTSWC